VSFYTFIPPLASSMMAPGLPKVAEKFGKNVIHPPVIIMAHNFQSFRYHQPHDSRDDTVYLSHLVRFGAACHSALVGNVWPHMGKPIACIVCSCAVNMYALLGFTHRKFGVSGIQSGMRFFANDRIPNCIPFFRYGL
jgi:hypothetical protein